MLIVFKSKASGDVIMFGDVALQLLDVIGKGRDKQGIITVEQLPDAIHRLEQAAADSKAKTTAPREPEPERAPDGDRSTTVSLALRVVPLIELLERSHRAKTPVTWGV